MHPPKDKIVALSYAALLLSLLDKDKRLAPQEQHVPRPQKTLEDTKMAKKSHIRELSLMQAKRTPRVVAHEKPVPSNSYSARKR